MAQLSDQSFGMAKTVDDDTSVVGNAWKVAPGDHARVWNECRNSGCITINWLNYWNFTGASEQEIRQRLPKKGDGSRGAHSIHQFVNEIQVKDVIVANNGLSHVEGIGIVTSEYLPPDHRDNPRRKMDGHRHARLVKWLVKEPIDLHRPLFIRPTVEALDPVQCYFIKRAYLKRDPELQKMLDWLLPSDSQSSLAVDIEEVAQNQNIPPTTKKALIDARLGQGTFRTKVLQRWGQRCAVTSSVTVKAIRASHILPWSESTDKERLDPDNGLPLIANLDALFDRGLISFEVSGRMIVSSELNAEERQILGIGENSLTKTPTAKMAVYLAHHRNKHGFK